MNNIFNVEKSKDNRDIIRLTIDNRNVYLGSKYSVEKDINKLFEDIGDISEKSIIIIFGLGAGEYIEELLQKSRKSTKIVIVEFDDNIINYIKNRYNLRGIEIATKETIVEKILNYVNEFNVKDVKTVIYNGYINVYGNHIKETLSLLSEIFNKINVNRNTNMFFSEKWFEAFFDNFKYVLESTFLTDLKDKFKNEPAIIVSAGPSLSKNIKKLTSIQDNFHIITGGRPLRALDEVNVKADIISVVDAGEVSYELVKDYVNSDIPLAFTETTNSKFLKEYQGKKIYIPTGEKATNDVLDIEISGFKFGGSVAHYCTAVALVLGCNPIIFIGQDLAYTNNKLHSDETTLDCNSNIIKENNELKPNETLVRDINGNMIKTSIVLNGFRMEFEKLIEAFPHIRFINATEGGANIKGTEISNLDDDIKNYLGKTLDGQYRDNISKNINKIEKSLNKTLELCNEGLRINNSLIRGVEQEKYIKKLNKIDDEISKLIENSSFLNFILYPTIILVYTEEKWIINEMDTFTEKKRKIYEKSKCLYENIIAAIKKTKEKREFFDL